MLWGIAALAPWITSPVVLLLAVAVPAFPQSTINPTYLLWPLGILWMGGGILGMAAMAMCAFDMRRQSFTTAQKIGWTLAYVFWPIAAPLYWHRYVWTEKENPPASQ